MWPPEWGDLSASTPSTLCQVSNTDQYTDGSAGGLPAFGNRTRLYRFQTSGKTPPFRHGWIANLNILWAIATFNTRVVTPSRPGTSSTLKVIIEILTTVPSVNRGGRVSDDFTKGTQGLGPWRSLRVTRGSPDDSWYFIGSSGVFQSVFGGFKKVHGDVYRFHGVLMRSSNVFKGFQRAYGGFIFQCTHIGSKNLPYLYCIRRTWSSGRYQGIQESLNEVLEVFQMSFQARGFRGFRGISGRFK